MKRRLDKKKVKSNGMILDLKSKWSKFDSTKQDLVTADNLSKSPDTPKPPARIKPVPNQKNSKILLNQGLKFYNKGEYKKAINCFQIVLDIDPKNNDCQEHLTDAYLKLDEKEKMPDLFTKNVLKDKCQSFDISRTNNSSIFSNSTLLRRNNKDDALEIGGMIEEISKRKNAEESLRVLSSAVEQSTEGIAVSTLDGDLLFVNNALAQMHGYKPEKVVGKNQSVFHTPEQISAVKIAEGKIEQTGEFHGELWHVRSDGSIFPTLTHQSLLWDDDDNPIGLISTHRDITKLKKSEEEIRKLSSAVEQSIDGIAICDLEFEITYVNDAFARMHGYIPKDMIGMKFEHLHNNRQINKLKSGMRKIEQRGSWAGEIGCVRNDGGTFPSYISITLLKDDAGNPIGSLTITRDITVQKKMEKKIKRYTEHLEDEVKKRTNELIQREKMGSLGQLVAGVAQEINNPLGFINSNTGIIEEHIQSLKECNDKNKLETILDDISNLLKTNINGLDKIIKITRSLERFALPNKGEKAPVDINQGIKDTLLILSNQIPPEINIHEDYGKFSKIIANIGQLNQVFMNIILNATEAMDKGNIWIKTRKTANELHIRIEDDGSGISEEELAKVFDPFFTTKVRGAGLGLSLSYRIIQALGGKINIKSKEGLGTKVMIILPKLGDNDQRK